MFLNFIESFIADEKTNIIIAYSERFFNSQDALGFIGIFYVVLAAFLFLRDYEDITFRLTLKPKTNNLASSIILYLKIIATIPIGLILFVFSHNFLNSYILAYLVILFIFFIAYIISIGDKDYKKVFIVAVIASSVWFVLKIIFLFYIRFNQAYNTLYGSLAYVFLFLLWLYLSWIIFLYGLKHSR